MNTDAWARLSDSTIAVAMARAEVGEKETIESRRNLEIANKVHDFLMSQRADDDLIHRIHDPYESFLRYVT